MTPRRGATARREPAGAEEARAPYGGTRQQGTAEHHTSGTASVPASTPPRVARHVASMSASIVLDEYPQELNADRSTRSNEPAQSLVVHCSDGVSVWIPPVHAHTQCRAFHRMKKEGRTSVAINNVSSLAVKRVIEYCSMHSRNENAGPATGQACPALTDLRRWDERFIRLEPPHLCELASAAYYLDIKSLVDLTCQAIALLLKGKSAPEIRSTFKILYDFGLKDDAPPPTTRDRLRTKLSKSQRKRDADAPSEEDRVEDSRSVDDLLVYIESSPGDGACSKSAKKKLRRQRQREKRARGREHAQRKKTESESGHSSPTRSGQAELGSSSFAMRADGSLTSSDEYSDEHAGAAEGTPVSGDDRGAPSSKGAGHGRANGIGAAHSGDANRSGGGGEEGSSGTGFELDPALQEEEDTLVEAFRLRLEAATHAAKDRISLAPELSQSLIQTLQSSE